MASLELVRIMMMLEKDKTFDQVVEHFIDCLHRDSVRACPLINLSYQTHSHGLIFKLFINFVIEMNYHDFDHLLLPLHRYISILIDQTWDKSNLIDGNNALCHLCSKYSPSTSNSTIYLLMKCLLSGKCNPNDVNIDGVTPILLLANSHLMSMSACSILLMLDYGANPDVTHPKTGRSILHFLIKNQYVEAMQELCSSDWSMRLPWFIKDKKSRTPLQIAMNCVTNEKSNADYMLELVSSQCELWKNKVRPFLLQTILSSYFQIGINVAENILDYLDGGNYLFVMEHSSSSSSSSDIEDEDEDEDED